MFDESESLGDGFRTLFVCGCFFTRVSAHTMLNPPGLGVVITLFTFWDRYAALQAIAGILCDHDSIPRIPTVSAGGSGMA